MLKCIANMQSWCSCHRTGGGRKETPGRQKVKLVCEEEEMNVWIKKENLVRVSLSDMNIHWSFTHHMANGGLWSIRNNDVPTGSHTLTKHNVRGEVGVTHTLAHIHAWMSGLLCVYLVGEVHSGRDIDSHDRCCVSWSRSPWIQQHVRQLHTHIHKPLFILLIAISFYPLSFQFISVLCLLSVSLFQLSGQRQNRAGSSLQRHLPAGEPPLCCGLPDILTARLQHILQLWPWGLQTDTTGTPVCVWHHNGLS